MGKRYHYRGHEIGVTKWEKWRNRSWIVAWTEDGKQHRVVSKALRPQFTAEEMQKLLDDWAEEKGLEALE
jgi:hypothetical protein